MNREDATVTQLEATRKILDEVAEVLSSYRGAVIVGGSVPYLLIPQEIEPHVGTIDIDVVLDPVGLEADSEITLHDALERREFVQDNQRPFRYTKGLTLGSERHQVLLEFLGGGNPPPNGLKRIPSEDVYVSVIPGLEVALENPILIDQLGGQEQTLFVASLPAFIAMKTVALRAREERKKGKDAYDIIYCLRNYPGGIQSIVQAFLMEIESSIVREGIGRLREQFSHINAVGPSAYAQQADEEDAALKRREAFERVEILLKKIDEAQ